MLMSVNVWGASKTSTLTFTKACSGSGTADDGVTWTVTSDAAESTYDDTKGIHYGTSSKAISNLTLTSGSFDKKITKVVVNCSDANKTAMISVAVGEKEKEKEFGTSQQETAYNNSAYTFEPTAAQGSDFSGVVVVSMSRTSAKKALYVKSIAVTYDDGQGADPVLQSIAISGTPNKTTYETGESFDVTGLTVTGTYDDASTDDLTDDAEWTIDPATFTSTSQNSVSVTATVGEESDTKQYNVTVTEHDVVPGTYEISLNNALYGISTGNNGTEQSAKVHDITVVSGCASDAGSKTYYAAAHIRYYAKSYLKLSVPTGYEITSVVFTEPSSASDKRWDGSITSTPDSYNADTKTWTGKSQNVDFAFGAQNRAAKITVTFAEKKVVSSIAVKTAPTKSTYYVGDEFDPAGLVITASYASGDPEDIAYSDANKDAFSFSGFNSAAEATGQVITVTYAEKSATFNVDIQAARTLNSIEVATNPTKMVYEVGEALDLTGLVVNGIYSTGDPEAVEYTASPANGAILDAVGNTTVTLTSVDNTELTTSFNVTVNAIEGDRLTLASTGVSSGGSYAEWTGKTGSEGVAVYAGKSAGGNSSIQLNTSNPQGIVSTTSGGLIRKVKVDWNSSTSSTGNRSIDIYGSNTAYTGSGDIYNTEKQGTKLGSIVCGTSTELEISGDYEYVGVRAISGALYMNSITFVWAAPKELVGIAVKTAPTVVDYAAGEFFNPAGLEITASYDDESTADIAYEGNEDKFSFSPALDVALATTDEKVTITYGGKSCDQAITVKNIELTSIVVSGDLTKTEYTEGDDFDFTGLVATGHYSDESHKTITEQVVWSIDPATLTAGQTSVKVIATMNEVSGDETYGITVAAAPLEVTWDATAQGYENSQDVTEADFNAIINAEFEEGKYYTTGTAVRVYNGKTFAIHAASGYKITSIVIGFGSGDKSNEITADCGTYSNGTWTGLSKDVTFTVGGTKDHRRLMTFTVTYAVAAPSAATPTITPSAEAEIYWEPITVTLATTTADAAIYYTIDDTDPKTASDLYENPINVEATTTIKAIAVKDGLDNSEVATKTFNFGPVYANLVDLVNAGEPTTTGKTVKVTLTNEEIAAFDGTQGIYIDVPTDPVKRIEVYCKNRPEAWVVGGTVSGTLQCTWKKYSGTWELCPTSWTELAYNPPAGTTEVVLTGTPTKNVYVDGEAFDPTGITVTATINGVPTVVTEGITWSVETLTLGTTSIDITATYNNVVSNTIENFAVTVNEIQESTIANFIENEGGRCYLIGTVSDFNSSTKRFNLTDATGTLYIYSHSLATGITEVANDDYIKVLAETYSTKYENAENVVVVEKLDKPQVDVKGISLNKTETTITIGKTETLVATIEPLDASDKGVSWSSSDETVATVEGGVVTAVAEGTAVITVTTNFKKEEVPFTATCNVSVVAAQVKYFALATSTADLDAAVTNGKKVVIAPNTNQTETVVMGTYESGNNIKPVNATYADKRIALEVEENAFYTIAKDGDYYTLKDGNGKYIYAEASNHLKANSTLSDAGRWTISIDASKNAIITCKAEVTSNTIRFNNSTATNLLFSCYSSTSQKAVSIYVEADKPAYIPVESIVLNETSAEVMVGKKLTLTATIGPDNATQKGVTWTSNNEKVTVDANGLVTVDAEATVGATATITATTVGTTTDGGTEHLSATCVITVIAPVVNNYYLVTAASTLHAGDIIVLGATKDGKSYINGDLSGDHLTSVDATITDDVLSTADAFEFVLGGEEGAWTLTSVNGALGATAVKKLTYVGTQTGFVGTWTISIDEDNNATIAPDAEGYGRFMYNAGSPRFLTYTSDASATMLLPQLYRKYETIRTDMTDGQIGTGCQTKNILDVKGATLYQVNYTYGSYLEFMEVTYPVEAGMPIIMQADGTNGGKVEVLYGNEVATKGLDKDGLYGYIGSKQFDIPEGYPYYVFKGGMLRPSQGNYTTSGHAYINLDEVPTTDQTVGSPAPRRRMSVGIERSMPTGFETIMMQKGMNKVIMNNQLFIIRDGKLFNAQGALVK